jgi:hypothetical protein
MKFLIPTLPGDKYANLITAFAVIVAVEYASGLYDAWDVFIGILAIVLGYSFINPARKLGDFWYSFITASMIALGLTSIANALILNVFSAVAPTCFNDVETRFGQFFQVLHFVIFVIISFTFKKVYIKNEHQKST